MIFPKSLSPKTGARPCQDSGESSSATLTEARALSKSTRDCAAGEKPLEQNGNSASAHGHVHSASNLRLEMLGGPGSHKHGSKCPSRVTNAMSVGGILSNLAAQAACIFAKQPDNQSGGVAGCMRSCRRAMASVESKDPAIPHFDGEATEAT